MLIHVVAFRLILKHFYEVGSFTGEETEAEKHLAKGAQPVRKETGP